ncbi:MAG: ABC transporter permease [Dehalobacterium sp.]
MARYLMKKSIYFLLVLLGVCIIGFVVVYLTGDPATAMAPPEYTPEQVEQLRISMGLDEPMLVQFGVFMKQLFGNLDLGTSFRYNTPVFDLVVNAMKGTYILAGWAFLVSMTCGLLFGILAGINRGKFLDTLFTSISVLGQSMPTFWTAIICMLIFSINLKVLPVSGSASWQCLVLPALTLGFYSAARISLLTRSGIIDVMSQDYIRTARAKGLKEIIVVGRHGLVNAMIPVVTMLGLELGTMMAGAVVTEVIFAWPGIGRLMADAVIMRDFPVVRGALIMVGLNFLVINFIVDLLYSVIDPRIRV